MQSCFSGVKKESEKDTTLLINNSAKIINSDKNSNLHVTSIKDTFNYDSIKVYEESFPFGSAFFYDGHNKKMLEISIKYPYLYFTKTSLSNQFDLDNFNLKFYDGFRKGYLKNRKVNILSRGTNYVNFVSNQYDIVYENNHIIESLNGKTNKYSNISLQTKDSLLNVSEYNRVHLKEDKGITEAYLSVTHQNELSNIVYKTYLNAQANNIDLDDITLIMSAIVEKDGSIISKVSFKYKDMNGFMEIPKDLRIELENQLTANLKTIKFSAAKNNSKFPVRFLYQQAFSFYPIDKKR